MMWDGVCVRERMEVQWTLCVYSRMQSPARMVSHFDTTNPRMEKCAGVTCSRLNSAIFLLEKLFIAGAAHSDCPAPHRESAEKRAHQMQREKGDGREKKKLKREKKKDKREKRVRKDERMQLVNVGQADIPG